MQKVCEHDKIVFNISTEQYLVVVLSALNLIF